MTGHEPLRDLLDRAAEGDDVALGRLVERTQADVWRLCSALGSEGEVEDLVQETYLRLISAVPTFRGESSVRTWLLAIARNICADHVRRRERQRRLVDRLSVQTVEVLEAAPTEPDALLAGLSHDRREAFVLTQLLGLSYEEAAEIIGCPVGTIRSRVHRAREDLVAAVRRQEQTG